MTPRPQNPKPPERSRQQPFTRSMTPYVEPPDIPEGMTIAEWKRTGRPRQQAFTRSHHRISARMRAGTLTGSMGGDPRSLRGGETSR